MKYVSTQRHLDWEIVESKIANRDFGVQAVSLTIDGEEMLFILDGHHSFAAAIEAKSQPEITINNAIQQEADSMSIDDFLEAHWMDSELYNIETGENIF